MAEASVTIPSGSAARGGLAPSDSNRMEWGSDPVRLIWAATGQKVRKLDGRNTLNVRKVMLFVSSLCGV